ncbi:uncharacterized protein DDB_G0284671-like [Camellia sinensis]|uniref:uncharacterized protein DDB_G0284671-like n=1 Tax=Camellia sinensis TaxID=4442 RepID=UPI001036AD4D|nr:uncharacterized protein DDB_G0284671-like [Camellia sinensis]
MRAAESLSPQEITDFMRGTDVDRYIREGDYTIYIQTYLMPLLIGARVHTGRAANVPSSSRARAADAPSTSRARAPRDGARGMPLARQSVGWPDLPTELTGQTSADWTSGDRGMAISTPPVVGRDREAPAHGRGRHHEPVMHEDDDETSEDEKAASPQSESSGGGDDGTGSGSEGGDDAEEGSKDGNGGSSGSGSGLESDNGVDGDSATESTLPRKRTKRASQS